MMASTKTVEGFDSTSEAFSHLSGAEMAEAREIAEEVRRVSQELLHKGDVADVADALHSLAGRQEDTQSVAATNAVIQYLKHERESMAGEYNVVDATKLDFEISLLDAASNAGKLAVYHNEQSRP